jgi:hypothetical protein
VRTYSKVVVPAIPPAAVRATVQPVVNSTIPTEEPQVRALGGLAVSTIPLVAGGTKRVGTPVTKPSLTPTENTGCGVYH